MKRLPNIGLSYWLCLFIAFIVPSEAAQHSDLWGQSGEKWQPGSRLPDFSYAGYHRGEKSLPDRVGQISVKTFGAVGNGQIDDTEAFRKAIVAAKGKVLVIPQGRYKITDFIDIRSRGTVLKGVGPDRSVLFFPTPLNVIKPNWGATTSGRRTSNYSWSGGFLRIMGSLPGKALAKVIAPAKRGDRSLRISTAGNLKVGQEVQLSLRDRPDNSLATHLYAGDPGSLQNLKGRSRESFICRLTKVDRQSSHIEFDRPLRTDVEMAWNPQLYPAHSSVEEVGIEGLRFEFPNTPYRGHFTEVGYNAIAVSGARHCWLRNLRIHNADSGIFVSGKNVTVQDILITSDRPIEKSRKATGHHGVTIGGQDNLLTRFEFKTRFMHDITMTRGSAGNVISSGRGLDLCFDHHCYGPHANLFTDLDLGLGSRMFQSGGGAALGRHSAAFETFWNIRGQRAQKWPEGWGPDLMNFVAVQTQAPSVTDRNGRWFESIDPAQISPANLHQAQLRRRLE